jgi:hypothetical protein
MGEGDGESGVGVGAGVTGGVDGLAGAPEVTQPATSSSTAPQLQAQRANENPDRRLLEFIGSPLERWLLDSHPDAGPVELVPA